LYVSVSVLLASSLFYTLLEAELADFCCSSGYISVLASLTVLVQVDFAALVIVTTDAIISWPDVARYYYYYCKILLLILLLLL